MGRTACPRRLSACRDLRVDPMVALHQE